MQLKRFSYILITIMLGAVIFWRLSLSFMITEPRRITFSQDLANQISVGMTRDEAEEILNCPPGDYTTGPCDEPPCGPWTFVCDWWVSDTGAIGVWFDEGEKVKKVVFRAIQKTPHPFWEEILTRLQSLGTSSRPPKIAPRKGPQSKWADFVEANGGRVERKKGDGPRTQGVVNSEPTTACR